MSNSRFVAKATAGEGWRIWNRRTKRWWGNYFSYYPEELLEELNGESRPERIPLVDANGIPTGEHWQVSEKMMANFRNWRQKRKLKS